ncbi:MAG: DNA-binding protein [Gammaproteobacteria bacterium]|nr:DNA-binding protein [Gammaproteobacteria bacterium]
MKTITLKADDTFDALLTGLARNLNTTKSGVMRSAVLNYKKHVERAALGRQVREASLKVREEALEYASEFEAADADGL